MTYNKLQPGVHKLLRHPEHLAKIKQGVPVAPLHVSLWPNSLCNLQCPYCCGKGIKDRGKELTLEEFQNLTDVLVKYGTKAMEFSGVVGEPLLWTHFQEGVRYAHSRGLKLSLITNGVMLKKVPKEVLDLFSWIRVSLQSLAHAKSISFAEKISGSFMVHDDKSFEAIEPLSKYAVEKDFMVRIAAVRPCTVEWENKVRGEVNRVKGNIFFAEKPLGTPEGCYMAWVRAGIDWEGNFIPCPSVELNHENQNTIPENFKLCHISKLEEWILNNPPRDLGYKCTFCNCGKENNDFIHNLLKDEPDDSFV